MRKFLRPLAAMIALAFAGCTTTNIDSHATEVGEGSGEVSPNALAGQTAAACTAPPPTPTTTPSTQPSTISIAGANGATETATISTNVRTGTYGTSIQTQIRVGDRLIGEITIIAERDGSVRFGEIVVDPAYRDRGVGNVLFERAFGNSLVQDRTIGRTMFGTGTNETGFQNAIEYVLSQPETPQGLRGLSLSQALRARQQNPALAAALNDAFQRALVAIDPATGRPFVPSPRMWARVGFTNGVVTVSNDGIIRVTYTRSPFYFGPPPPLQPPAYSGCRTALNAAAGTINSTGAMWTTSLNATATFSAAYWTLMNDLIAIMNRQNAAVARLCSDRREEDWLTWVGNNCPSLGTGVSGVERVGRCYWDSFSSCPLPNPRPTPSAAEIQQGYLVLRTIFDSQWRCPIMYINFDRPESIDPRTWHPVQRALGATRELVDCSTASQPGGATVYNVNTLYPTGRLDAAMQGRGIDPARPTVPGSQAIRATPPTVNACRAWTPTAMPQRCLPPSGPYCAVSIGAYSGTDNDTTRAGSVTWGDLTSTTPLVSSSGYFSGGITTASPLQTLPTYSFQANAPAGSSFSGWTAERGGACPCAGTTSATCAFDVVATARAPNGDPTAFAARVAGTSWSVPLPTDACAISCQANFTPPPTPVPPEPAFQYCPDSDERGVRMNFQTCRELNGIPDFSDPLDCTHCSCVTGGGTRLLQSLGSCPLINEPEPTPTPTPSPSPSPSPGSGSG